MINVEKHLYKKKLDLKNVEGEIETFEFVALNAIHLPKLFKCISKFKEINFEKEPEKILEVLDEETVKDFVDLVTETVKKSYPKLEDSEVDIIVSGHFMEIFPLVITLNLDKGNSNN